MRMLWCVGLVLGLAWAGRVEADHPAGAPHPFWHCWGPLCPPVGCCPDDYARKPLPPLCDVPRCGGPDDYCRKPLPCDLGVPRGGGPDDYCRKPLPCLLCPPLSPYLHCGPAAGPCSAGGDRR